MLKPKIIKAMAMASYNPQDWYWKVAGEATKVYSSVTGDYVTLSTPAYVAWVSAGNTATPIVSEVELGEVLAPYSLRPVNAAVLDAYKDAQAVKLTMEIVSKILFNHENRLRVQESVAPVTPAQAKNWVKGLM